MEKLTTGECWQGKDQWFCLRPSEINQFPWQLLGHSMLDNYLHKSYNYGNILSWWIEQLKSELSKVCNLWKVSVIVKEYFGKHEAIFIEQSRYTFPAPYDNYDWNYREQRESSRCKEKFKSKVELEPCKE